MLEGDDGGTVGVWDIEEEIGQGGGEADGQEEGRRRGWCVCGRAGGLRCGRRGGVGAAMSARGGGGGRLDGWEALVMWSVGRGGGGRAVAATTPASTHLAGDDVRSLVICTIIMVCVLRRDCVDLLS